VDLLLYREQIICGIAALNGAKCYGMLLYKEHIGCGIVAVKRAICVRVLLYKGGNWLGDSCCKGNKIC